MQTLRFTCQDVFLLFMHNPWEFHFYRTKKYSPFETSNTRSRQKGQPCPLQARHPWNYPHTHRHQSAVSWSLAHDSPKNQWKGRIMLPSLSFSLRVFIISILKKSSRDLRTRQSTTALLWTLPIWWHYYTAINQSVLCTLRIWSSSDWAHHHVALTGL